MALVVITGQAAIRGMAATTDMEIIMGPVGTMGMEIRIALGLRSAQGGVDGDQGGGVLRPTRIIHLTRTIPIIQHHRLLSHNNLRRMFSRISRNPIIGTTVRIPGATTPTLTLARAGG